MNHDQIRGRLDEWLDGALAPADSAAASTHIDGCADCKSEVARLKRLGAALYGGFAAAPAPADPRSTEAFVARVMARVAADAVSPWERFAARVLAPAFGLALAGLIFAISLPSADEDAPLGVAMVVDADAVMGVAP